MPVEVVGPAGASLHAITTPDSSHLPRLIELFKTVFPEYDSYIRYLELSADRAHPPRPTTLDHLWLVELAGEPVAFRLFSYLPQRRFGFGAYTGVLPACRGLGIGRWLMVQTLNQVMEDAAALGHADVLGCCVEIMRVEPEQTEAEQARNAQSLAFHLRCGALLLDVPYRELQIGWNDIQAGVTDLNGIPKHLAIYPAPTHGAFTAADLQRLIEGIYRDVYLQPPDHPVLREVMRVIIEGTES